MKAKHLTWFIALSSLVFQACEKEIPMGGLYTTRKIVLNATVFPDSLFSAFVCRSLFIKDNSQSVLLLPDANVGVYEEDQLIEKLQYQSEGMFSGQNKVAQIGHSYEYRVSSSGLTAVKSDVKVLPPVAILAIDSVGETFDEFGNATVLFRIKMKDEPGQKNYYRLKLSAKAQYLIKNYETGEITDTLEMVSDIDFESSDPAFEDKDYRSLALYFSDEMFNGEDRNLEISFSKWAFSSYTKVLYVCIEQVSEGLFYYARSVKMQDDSQGMELFFQTTQVFNNIENGLGILGCATPSIDSLVNKHFVLSD